MNALHFLGIDSDYSVADIELPNHSVLPVDLLLLVAAIPNIPPVRYSFVPL